MNTLYEKVTGHVNIVAVMATEELKAIRKRMVEFITEFEFIFQEHLNDTQAVISQLFSSAQYLVEKHFCN